jgi:hypothetical protein
VLHFSAMDVNGKPIQLDDKQDKILKEVSVCAFVLVLFGGILGLLVDWLNSVQLLLSQIGFDLLHYSTQ